MKPEANSVIDCCETIRLSEADIAAALILSNILGDDLSVVDVTVVNNSGFASGVYATVTKRETK